MDELQSKHRKEQKDLQARITQKKKNATKKTRKGVNDECEALERDLAQRQQSEIDALNGNVLENGILDLSISEEEPITSDHAFPEIRTGAKQVSFDPASTHLEVEQSDQQVRPKKPNRQKARLARRAAEQEAQVAAAGEEARNLPDLRQQELTAMKEHMDKLQLKETFVRPNGHCLYSACALGITEQEPQTSTSSVKNYQDIRCTTAAFIAKHPDDFSAFIEEPIESYVTKIRDTAEWGGQVELQAIARSYKVNINVLQSDGRIENITPSEHIDPATEIWLAYYRHSFGLGEHYNALSKV